MRRLIPALALVMMASSALAKETPPGALEKSPVVGRWMAKAKLGDGSSFGFELKADGYAKAINTATIGPKCWLWVDNAHIEMAEVTEGVGSPGCEVVKYEVKVNKDGSIKLSSGKRRGFYDGLFVRVK